MSDQVRGTGSTHALTDGSGHPFKGRGFSVLVIRALIQTNLANTKRIILKTSQFSGGNKLNPSQPFRARLSSLGEPATTRPINQKSQRNLSLLKTLSPKNTQRHKEITHNNWP
jgi:hypothetical protein